VLAAAAADTTDMGWNFVSEAEELKEAFNSGGVEAFRALLEKKRDKWKQIPRNVAVIGRPGVGKSSFINAIRRVDADDEGAAPVAVRETTVTVDRSYPHPRNPLLKFWDLPGVGTSPFPRQTYLSHIQVDRFDFFVLITADRFTQDDTWLGREFAKRKKKYFFVRTKVGADISNNEQAHPKTHKEDDVVRDILESTQEHLKKNGCEKVPVFLIDSYKIEKFDFNELERRLIKDFPKLKKADLVLSLQATSREMISLKVAELRSRMWKRAALSGAVAAIPVPFVSMAMDIGFMAKEFEFYCTQLGLDEISLRRYTGLTNKGYEELRLDVEYKLGFAGVITNEAINMVAELPEKACTLASLAGAAVGELTRFIPFIRPLIAAPLSFAKTCCALKLVLRVMESVALAVIRSTVENCAVSSESDETVDD